MEREIKKPRFWVYLLICVLAGYFSFNPPFESGANPSKQDLREQVIENNYLNTQLRIQAQSNQETLDSLLNAQK